MQLQTFQGSTMAEALQRVKTQLGGDAVILHTRTIHHKRWMGLKRIEMFEITASRNVNVVKRQLPARPAPAPVSQPRPTPQPAVVKHDPKAFLQTPAASNAALLGLTTEVQQLRGMMKDLVTQVRVGAKPDVPQDLFEHYLSLTEHHVAEELALEIVKTLQRQLRPELLSNKEVVHEKLAEHLEKLIPTSGPITRTKTHGPHIVALIGRPASARRRPSPSWPRI